MVNLLNLMYSNNSWMGNKIWLGDRMYPYFHIAINHPDVNGVKKHSWKR